MKVINKQERLYARWRFVGLYVVSLAIPALLVFNSLTVEKVDTKEKENLLEQLRKRDQALAKLTALAGLLDEIIRLKPAYETLATDQARYDHQRFEFERGLEGMKRLYYDDTILYHTNYALVSFLDNHYRGQEKIAQEHRNKVIVQVQDVMDKTTPNQVSDIKMELLQAQNETQFIKSRLENCVRNYDRLNGTLIAKNTLIDSKLNAVLDQLIEVETECNGILKKSEDNLGIKNRVYGKLQTIKRDVMQISSNPSVSSN
jgi:hypothetical protein